MRRRTRFVLELYIITACLTVTNGVVGNGCSGCSAQDRHDCKVICKDEAGNIQFGNTVQVEVGQGQSIDAANSQCQASSGDPEIQNACPSGTTPVNCSCE